MKMEDMIMFEVDKNGDGMIQFDEFMDLVGNIEGDTVREKKATLKAFKVYIYIYIYCILGTSTRRTTYRLR